MGVIFVCNTLWPVALGPSEDIVYKGRLLGSRINCVERYKTNYEIHNKQLKSCFFLKPCV